VRPLTVKSQLAGGRRPIYGYADVWPVDEQWNDQLISLRADDEVVVSLPENRSTGYRWMFDDEVVEVTPEPEPPAMGDTSPTILDAGGLSHFLQAAGTVRPGRPPGAALDRARRVPRPATSASADRILPGGAAVVGDDYLPGRTIALRPSEARRARLAAAAGGMDDSTSQAGTLEPPATDVDVQVRIGATGRRLFGVRFIEPGPKTLRLQHRSPYSSAPAVEEYVLHAIVEPRRQGFSIDQLVDDPDEAWVVDARDHKAHQPMARIDEPESD
jgi:hypothetical protein